MDDNVTTAQRSTLLQLISEAQAKEKLCPTMTAASVSTDGPDITCQGSRCMAWRGVTTQRGPEGYCGMAGRPPAIDEAINAKTVEAVTEQMGGMLAMLGDLPRILRPS